jgi:hypothetical protein
MEGINNDRQLLQLINPTALGLTLWGMVLLPTSPLMVRCLQVFGKAHNVFLAPCKSYVLDMCVE